MIFQEFHDKGLSLSQQNIDAACLSTFNLINNEISSRFVNIKYIENNKFIFFSNFESPKAKDIETFNKVSCNFFWSNINIQIRLKGEIKKTSEEYSDQHFKNRTKEKNILSISSNQSQKIDSYDAVLAKYNKLRNDDDSFIIRPDYWGGYEISPSYYEFWEGCKNRLNKRQFFKLNNEREWETGYLEP